MRTTVNVNDQLLAQAKAVAATTGRTLGGVLDDALRILLAQRHAQTGPTPRRVSLPVAPGGGLVPGVDLEDKEALSELLGDNRMPPYAPS